MHLAKKCTTLTENFNIESGPLVRMAFRHNLFLADKTRWITMSLWNQSSAIAKGPLLGRLKDHQVNFPLETNWKVEIITASRFYNTAD
jgi:hypothetical protein